MYLISCVLAGAPEPEAARAQLEDAVESREQDLLEPAIDRFKSVTPRRQRKDDPLLARAERLLEMIKCRDGRFIRQCHFDVARFSSYMVALNVFV